MVWLKRTNFALIVLTAGDWQAASASTLKQGEGSAILTNWPTDRGNATESRTDTSR
jgi:hypothetical protein